MIDCPCVFFIPLFLLAYLVWKLYKSGIFDNIEVTVSEKPPFVSQSLTVFYKHHIGPYKYVGKYLKNAMNMMPTSDPTAFGIYYDNPSEIKEHLLQSATGVVFGVDGKDLYDKEIAEELKKAGYERLVLPAVEKGVVATQKFDGFFSFITLAKFTYSKINLFVQKNRLNIRFSLEFYEKGKVHIIMPLDHQGEFLVRELMSVEELETKLARKKFDSEESDSCSDPEPEDAEGTESESPAEEESPKDKKNE